MDKELFDILENFERLRADPDVGGSEEKYQRALRLLKDEVIGREIVSADNYRKSRSLEDPGGYLGGMMVGEVEKVSAHGLIGDSDELPPSVGGFLTAAPNYLINGIGDFARLDDAGSVVPRDLELWNDRKSVYGPGDEFMFAFDQGRVYSLVRGNDPFNAFLSLEVKQASLEQICCPDERIDIPKGHLFGL